MAGGTTPEREVWLELDGPEYSRVLRPGYRQNWNAESIGKADGWVARVNLDGSLQTVTGHQNTVLAPGNAWALQPLQQYRWAVLAGNFPGAILVPGHFTVAPNIKWAKMHRPPTDLPGAAGTGMFTTTPPQAMRRRVPAAQTWDHANAMLGSDQAAYPGPADPDYPDYLPVDRVAVSVDEYEPNMGFALTFAVQGGDLWGAPTFLRFYFGGPATMQPTAARGGEFCLSLRGNGRAILYERDQTIGPPPVFLWRRRMVFFWAPPELVSGGSHTVIVWPMARDRIVFYTRLTDQPAGPQGLVMPPALGGHVSNPTAHLYRDSPGQTGHMHLNAMTGTGKIRLDMMRSYRGPVVPPWLLKFPVTGFVTDQPFMIPGGLDAGTPMEVLLDGFALGGANIQRQLYNADTGAALATDTFGRFLAHQSQQKYFAQFVFNASSTQNQTPVLFGYTVEVPPEILVRVREPVAGKVREGSVTGPDIQPGHGSARVSIRDHRGAFTVLRTHDRHYCRLKVKVPTTGPSGDPRGYVIIHQGETWQPRATLRGREGFGNKAWWNYNVEMIDMWLRLQKQQNFQMVSYAHDPAGPILANGERAPPTILAAIRDLLHRAGVPYDEMDTPGWDSPSAVRFWPSPHLTMDDYLVTPGANLAAVLHRFAFDFLGKIVIRDPNAYNETNIERGMWRVLSPPAGVDSVSPPGQIVYPLGNSIAAFYVRRPAWLAEDPYVVEQEGALEADHPGLPATYVKDGSYVLYPQAPEGTSISVHGTAQLQVAGKGNQTVYGYLWNPKATDFSGTAPPTADPASVSFLDRSEPIHVYDPNLKTPDAVNYVAARIARQACVGRLWCEFVAPLLFVKDPADGLMGERRRPLRVYDQCTLYDEHGNAHPIMLRNVNPFWTGARVMWMHVQALLLDAR